MNLEIAGRGIANKIHSLKPGKAEVVFVTLGKKQEFANLIDQVKYALVAMGLISWSESVDKIAQISEDKSTKGSALRLVVKRV